MRPRRMFAPLISHFSAVGPASLLLVPQLRHEGTTVAIQPTNFIFCLRQNSLLRALLPWYLKISAVGPVGSHWAHCGGLGIPRWHHHLPMTRTIYCLSAFTSIFPKFTLLLLCIFSINFCLLSSFASSPAQPSRRLPMSYSSSAIKQHELTYALTTPPGTNLLTLSGGFSNLNVTIFPTAATTIADSPQNRPRQMTTRSFR
jgi:hypothetical protein